MLQLYNSLGKRLEAFEPLGDSVTIYACGITPYDTTHLGHAFTYTAIDILIRYLEYSGYKVKYAQNVTDIDDDILQRAQEVSEDWQSLGNRWTAHYIHDMQRLNVRPPDHLPRASDAIEEIVASVTRLREAGVAYESGGSVYFSIEAWPEYGKLSGIPPDRMLAIANERGNHPDDPHKRDPLDFVLWQAQAPGEPAWRSPWGPGRPGWHIECSTLATGHLGHSIDIHSGGADLIFPHHESEIAQVEPISQNAPFVRYWLHTAMVSHSGAKMSKSLGNLIMVRDLLDDWSPNSLRLYLASHHYRQDWEFDPEGLKEADRLAHALGSALVASGWGAQSLDPAPYLQAFSRAMDQDLDTPAALRVLMDLVNKIQALALGRGDFSEAQGALCDMGRVFGLRGASGEPEASVIRGWNRHLGRFAPSEDVPGQTF